MPAFSLNELGAIQEIAEVENALLDGFPPNTLIGSHDKTALREAAERMDVDPQSLRRRIGTVERPGSLWNKFKLKVDWGLYRPPPPSELPLGDEEDARKLAGGDKDRRIIGLQDEVARLTRELKDAHREANVEEILRDLIGGITGAARVMPEWLSKPVERRKGKAESEVPMTSWADWHLGEVVEEAEVNGVNAYNLEIAEDRIHRLVDKTIELCRDFHTGNYPGIVVNLVGDCVSGGIHPELKATDEEEVIPASMKAIDWTIASLTKIADHFGNVYVPAVCGNHGRTTAKPEYKRYAKKNWDYLIYQMVARHFADDKRVTFDIRDSNDVLYRVFNRRFLLAHGDMLGVKGGDGIVGAIGPIVRGEVKKSGQMSSIGHTFDQLIIGHWHQDLLLPRAIVSNTLKGFDEYARLQLGVKPTRPSQPLWFEHPLHGRTAYWTIYVEKEKVVPPQPWVSIFDEKKVPKGRS